MQIEQLEQTYGGFYVPTFVIEVGGQELVRDLFLTVSAVSVDLKEKTAGRFSFTVASVFDWEAREFVANERQVRVDLLELFAFGSPVEIAMGYGDPSKIKGKPLLTGLVTEVSTNFGSGSAPELTVSGYDNLYPLLVGRCTRRWENRRDSDAVSDVASDRQVPTDIKQTNPTKSSIDQNGQTDMAFIEKLAERNGNTYYSRAGKLYFGPRQNTSGDVLELEWGKGLLSFNPEANLARQITEVEVHGWSATRGEPILGKARRGDESGRDTRAQSGGDRVVTALSDNPVLRVRAAVHTQAEADARAKAILEERAQQFVTGRGETIGIPELVPDVNIALGGMGRGFSKTYYVSEATHTLNGSGYRTSFKVQETTV
jgi:uncharacterized protein